MNFVLNYAEKKSQLDVRSSHLVMEYKPFLTNDWQKCCISGTRTLSIVLSEEFLEFHACLW